MNPALSLLKDRWLPRACGLVPLALWHRVCHASLVVPHWHVVSDRRLPHVSGIYEFRSIRDFEADLEFFLGHYHPVSEEDVIAHLHEGRSLPSRCVLLTFDDGLREVHDVIAPLLLAKGVPASFFLVTSLVDNHELCYPHKASLLLRALATEHRAGTLQEVGRVLALPQAASQAQLASGVRSVSYRDRHVLDQLGRLLDCDFPGYLRAEAPYVTTEQVSSLLRQGFSIGAHSIDHPPYSELTVEEQVHQTQESVRWLSNHFEISCRSFAFPYRDAGVSLEYFRTVFKAGQVKVSFGTGGLAPHPFRYNLPRFSTERTDLTADKVLAVQLARCFRMRLPWRRHSGQSRPRVGA